MTKLRSGILLFIGKIDAICDKKKILTFVAASLFVYKCAAEEGATMLLPVWNHPTEAVEGAPAPQATACANSGQIAVTYVSLEYQFKREREYSFIRVYF